MLHRQADRTSLTTIKAYLSKFGRNTNAQSYSDPKYVMRAAHEVIEKNKKNKKKLSEDQLDALEELMKRVNPKPRKKPKKITY